MESKEKSRERAAIWWAANKDAYNEKRLAKSHDLSINELRRLRRERFCYICSGEQSNRWGGLNIDHDHETGIVRKMLCTRCNMTLGQVNDDIALLEAMIDYLKEHRG